jgi:tyrosine-protein kinase Etk/Wzc
VIAFWKRQEGVVRPPYREGVAVAQGRGSDDPLYRESLLALRARFEHRASNQGIRSVAVTSAVAGEGKTAVTCSLAILLATGGNRPVLLIDADMRKCDASTELGIPSSPGLSDFLEGRADEAEVVRGTHVPRLHFVPGGKRIENGAELLSGTRFREFLSRSRDRFGMVVIDTPPILPVADTLALKGQVDTFLFLHRAGKTPYSLLRDSMEEIGAASIIGVVLNGVEPQSDRYYTKYYGSYYGGKGGQR